MVRYIEVLCSFKDHFSVVYVQISFKVALHHIVVPDSLRKLLELDICDIVNVNVVHSNPIAEPKLHLTTHHTSSVSEDSLERLFIEMISKSESAIPVGRLANFKIPSMEHCITVRIDNLQENADDGTFDGIPYSF